MGVRTLLLLARLLVQDLASPGEPPPDAQAFVFLGHVDRAAVDERLLLDAVAIYTRDLGVALLQAPAKEPPSLSPAALEGVATLLRARGARLAFWCQFGPDGKQIELVTVDPRRTVARYAFPSDAGPRSDLYRSIALRLRAVLVGSDPGDAAAPGTIVVAAPVDSVAPATAPIAAPPASPRPETVAAAKAPPPEKAAPPEARLASAPPPPGASFGDRRGRVFFGVGYTLSHPFGTAGSAPARNALALDVTAVTHAHLEWDLGTDLAPAGDRTSGEATIAVLDIPLRISGRWVRQAGPFVVGAGPFAGIHWLSANASAGMLTDSRATFAGAAGADAVMRGPDLAGFAPQLRVWAEANLPRTRFTIQGVPNYDAGAIRVGFSVEFVAPAR